ncbi:MAG TPA: prolyl oligopeptidase family serine peptidase [Acidimicrobiales bacterium]|nr:prolyl oligopeptidase family serine peptidase [Acidimicrobiales bacterium]
MDVEPLPAAACAGGRSLSEPVLSPDGSEVAFVAGDEDGSRVVVVPTAGGPERVVAADPEPAGRGGVLAWVDGGIAYVTRDGGICLSRVHRVRNPHPMYSGSGAAALAASPDGRRLAFVDDTRAVSVVAAVGGDVEVVAAGADFALDPSWAPDGRLAWQEWDVPAMPWDESRVAVDGKPVAGGPDVAVQEPRWSPDGSSLAYLSDAGGWQNLWVGGRPLVAEEREHGGPAWGPGLRSFAWSPDGREIAFCRNEAGFGVLCVADVATGSVRELSRGVHSSITWAGDTIACLRSGARTPTSVVAVDPATGARRVLATGPSGDLAAAAAWMPEPEVVSWEGDDGAVVRGRLWRPPAGDDPPPLLVWAHGGPTGQFRVIFDDDAAFFLSRGFAVLHPDQRGSTGWGRGWAQALRGGWCDVDVADVAAGARAAVERGWGHPDRLVAVGSSSGGTVALLAAALEPDRWAGVVALYPVADLLDLVAATHRYEAHYPVRLIGPLPEAAGLYRDRSPLAVADRITAPVLLLHGADDPVVPAAQSERLAGALRSAEHHVYAGEKHGWRSPATARDALERTATFVSAAMAR